MKSLLEIENLTIRFGGLTAVKEVDLTVPQGQIFALIGPNGAGKTTVFNAVSGIYDPTSGGLKFAGRPLEAPRTTATIVAAILVGLATAVGSYLLVVNPDLLWKAVIRRPTNESLWLRQPFRFSEAVTRTGQYLRDDLTTEYAPRLVQMPLIEGRTKPGDPKLTYNVPGYEIVSSDGAYAIRTAISDATLEPELEAAARKYESLKRSNPDADGVAAAKNDRDSVLQRMADASRERAAGVLTALQQATTFGVVGRDAQRSATAPNPQWLLTADDRAIEGLEFPLELAAHDAVKTLESMRDNRPKKQAYRVIVPLTGLLLGIAGYFVVWNRARRTPDVIARGGIARTFQNIRLFHNMTVLENVLVGMDRHYTSSVLAMIFRTPAAREQERQRCDKAVALLKFMGLDDRCDTLAKNLPYGDQRRLEIARAMASEPQLLLLDEPAAGMNPAESSDLMTLIRAIRDRGITVLLIEHHMKLVMGISDRIAVLEYGVKIAEGTPEEVRKNPKVIEAYLGKEDVH